METPGARARTSTFTALVMESLVETIDARTLILDLRARASYYAGQYVTIDPHQFEGLGVVVEGLEQAKGRREAPRAYSVSSAPHEPHVAVTIKREVYDAGQTRYPPLLSGFLLHHLRAGDPVVVRGFLGTYILSEEAAAGTEHVLHLCAGSGSVANVSILKDALHRHPRLRHTFVYSNRTWQDIIFRDALEQLREQYRDRLRVIHTLTREPNLLSCGRDVRVGRIGLDLLRPILAHEPSSFVYVCGPAVTVRQRRDCAAQGLTPAPRFIEVMLDYLKTLHVPRARIKIESYG